MGGRAKDRKVDGEGGVIVRVLPANDPDVLTPPIPQRAPSVARVRAPVRRHPQLMVESNVFATTKG